MTHALDLTKQQISFDTNFCLDLRQMSFFKEMVDRQVFWLMYEQLPMAIANGKKEFGDKVDPITNRIEDWIIKNDHLMALLFRTFLSALTDRLEKHGYSVARGDANLEYRITWN